MTARRQAVGVLGGTFDPVHNGHLAMARRVLRALGLERVLMVLTARPPHKNVEGLTPYVHRAAMLDHAIADHDGLERSSLESDEGVSYTIDTLRRIRDEPPYRDPVFVMGSDSLLDLPAWHEAERLVEAFDLCVFDRQAGQGGEPVTALADRVTDYVRARMVHLEMHGEIARHLDRLRPGRGGRIFLLPGKPVAVSSSAVRAWVARGGDPTDLVPPRVARYIREHGMYRDRADETEEEH